MNNDLSPAAQAVLNHFLADVEINLEHGIAAALRAAAERMNCRDLGGPRDQWEQGFFVGVSSAKDELLAIAAELEGDHG